MAATTSARLIEQAVEDQRQVVRRLLHEGALPQLAGLDLTMAQLRALAVAVQHGPLPVGRLGVLLGVGKPAATLLVNALVRLGLVERNEDPADRRRTLVRVTGEAQELLDAFRQGGRERLARWLRQLDEGDLIALARGLRALAGVATADSRESRAS